MPERMTFVGRGLELQRLHEQLDATARGAGSVPESLSTTTP
jgi:hypothetical protein